MKASTLGVLILIGGIITAVWIWKPRKNREVERVVQIDTVYLTKTIRDTVPIMRNRYVIRRIVDTLYTRDSVKVPVIVPISQSVYAKRIATDSDTVSYRAFVSGYRAKLDSVRFDLKYNRSVTTIKKTGRRRFYFSHGVQAGLGFGLFSRKPDVYVGYGITFNF